MSISENFNRHKWNLLLLLFAIVCIKFFAGSTSRIESIYTKDFYRFFSVTLRFLFGWMPFSVGDVLYILAGCWLGWKLIKNIVLLFKRKFTREIFIDKLFKLILLFGTIYVVFNIFWGLNYNRQTIAGQMNLPAVKYDTANLKIMQQLLLQKVNETKQILIDKNVSYPQNKELFHRAKVCYDEAAVNYPLIEYNALSVKSSLFGLAGDYLGFTGYYNPFTGEAQVNTTVPKFLLPYISLHEMGHQLGYAKEDEANFSGYLAAANSQDTLFKYSAYLDLFMYANREVFYFDSSQAKVAFNQLIPPVKTDLLEWKRFNARYTSFLEPAISWLYGKYLQVNQQPKGLRSYNEVIATLMAYYKKYGKI
jgi:Protein of unknown function (DUF3810)